MYTADVLEILLSLSLLVHGIKDGLALGLVTLSQLINLPLHLLVQRGHALVQLLICQVLQLLAQREVSKEGGGEDKVIRHRCCDEVKGFWFEEGEEEDVMMSYRGNG